MGVLHRADGAPGRTRTSTDVNPPDFESGASTNSATGAPPQVFPWAARPDGKRPAAARIIANGARTASHWTRRGFSPHFPPCNPILRHEIRWSVNLAGRRRPTDSANAGKMRNEYWQYLSLLKE